EFQSTVTNLNGFLVLVERGCAEECIPGCEAHGFGLFWQECTRCCNSSLCNEWDGREYYKPNESSRNIGWTLLVAVCLLQKWMK
ncbi:hypothetical protein PRIPAC_78636, partial [Pristionchus pacificus]|uniref:Snake toxin/toxin-like domain-containing protein n=1 Tax=Pristionchus pacificus TaxID=54126 RepID=A0A8R1UJR5_PRIPA